ncbi:MAG: hypothetical protein KDD11_22025, partial [Acidobacteria bacterium]|nr:hypothetical protein [Acidobacteriota bacterium]
MKHLRPVTARRRPPKTPFAGTDPAFGLLVLVLVTLGPLACGGSKETPPEVLSLQRAVSSGDYSIGAGEVAGLDFSAEPRLKMVQTDYERRPSVVLPPGTWSWTGVVPEGAHLQVGASPTGPADLRLTATLHDGTTTEVLGVARSEDPKRPTWLDLGADLAEYAGRRVTLEVEASPAAPA